MKPADRVAALAQRMSWTEKHWVPFFSGMPLRTPSLGSLRNTFPVDETEKRLLEVVALSHAQNQPLTVSAAMALEPIASPNTPHRKLGLLHKLGEIDTEMFVDKKN
jgi:hypothetical protein